MAIIEDLKEPLVHGELNPSAISSSVFTAAENYPAFAKPLSNGHGDNPVMSHDLEEEGTSRWVWAEVYEQLWLAGPIMGMYFLQSVMVVVANMFVGHLGSLPLAAFTLSNAFTNMTGFTVLAGMASALETLCGQAYGAKQYHLLGIYLQRAIFILALACLPIGLVWVNMGRILVALGEDPVVAQMAQSLTYWTMPNLVEYVFLFPLIKYFQSQRAVFQLMLTMAVTTVLHVPLCWLIIDKLHVGLNGAANAWTIVSAVNMCLLFAFIRFSPRFHKTSPSLSRDAFQDFGEFFSLAIPSATMICLEAWSHEALTLLAGLLPNPNLNLSTFAICMGLLALCNMVSLALGVATSVRVSNELGAGKAHVARSVLAVSMVVGIVNGAVLASVIYWFRDVWGWAFTNDVEVVLHVAKTAPYLAALTLLYGIGAILSGVVRGIGWQRVGAIANLGAYYVVGLPVAVISVFIFKFDAKGLWLGMGCGLVTQIITLISITFCANWNQLAQEALLRSHSLSSRLPTLAASILEPFQEDKHSLEEFKK